MELERDVIGVQSLDNTKDTLSILILELNKEYTNGT